jgi:hypothetical protein
MHLRACFFLINGLLTLSLGLSQAFSQPVSMGQSYYLSPQGNDSAAGTSPEAAWRSLARANTHPFQPGDRLLLQGGATFEGQLTFEPGRCGTLEAPLRISSYGSERATIAPDSSHAIWLRDCSGLVIERLQLVGKGWEQTQHSGLVITSSGTDSLPRLAGVWLYDLEVSGFRGGGITLFVQPGAPGYRQVVLERVVAHHNGDHGISLVGDYEADSLSLRDLRITHCLAHHNQGLPDKTWSHSGNGIVVGNADTVLIAHCEAHHNGAQNAHRGGGPVGIWLWNTHHGVIEYCHAHHNQTGNDADGGGFDLDGGSQHCVMQHNVSHDNAGAGYLLAAFEGAPPLRHCVIRYNLSFDDGRANQYGGITLWRSRAALDSVLIYHNTIINRADGRGQPAGLRFLSAGIHEVGLYNNLFIMGPGVPWLSVVRPLRDFHSRGNVWVSLGKGGYGRWLGDRFYAENVPEALRQDWWGSWEPPDDIDWYHLHQRGDLPWIGFGIPLWPLGINTPLPAGTVGTR